MNQLLPIIV